MSWRLIVFLILLLAFSLGIRLFRVTEPQKYYFDEVYHAVTAKGYAYNNPAAYDPFAPPPEADTAYDWLHPPLAKLIQAGSIKILGDTPLGWRLPSVIFGTALIGAVFFLAKILFDIKVAIFASVVLAFENLTLVMSRITMNDIFLIFFVLVSLIFATLYIKNQKMRDLILTSVFLGLSVSTKWTGIYAIALVLMLILWQQFKSKKLNFKFLFLLYIPVVFYLASYGQFWLQGHSAQQFIDLHKQIWWYQNRHDLKHTYGTTALFCAPEGLAGPKSWCPWILDVRPVYFSYEEYSSKAGYIYALGNPIIFWIGIIAVSYLAGKFLEEKRWEYALVLLGYFIFWLPWIFSPRILFLYHYLPSLTFLSIALGVALKDIYEGKLKYLAIALVIIFAISFFYFYPITTGFPIDPKSIDNYMWLKTWR